MLTQYEAAQTFPKTIEIKHPKFIGKVMFHLETVVFADRGKKSRIVKNLGKDGYFTKVVEKSPKNFPLTAFGIYKKRK